MNHCCSTGTVYPCVWWRCRRDSRNLNEPHDPALYQGELSLGPDIARLFRAHRQRCPLPDSWWHNANPYVESDPAFIARPCRNRPRTWKTMLPKLSQILKHKWVSGCLAQSRTRVRCYKYCYLSLVCKGRQVSRSRRWMPITPGDGRRASGTGTSLANYAVLRHFEC